MPAFGDTLSDREIAAILAYIKSRWPADIRARQSRLGGARSWQNHLPCRSVTACRATVAALLEFAVDYNSDRLPFAQPEDWPEATIAMCPNLVRRRSVPERWVRLAPPLAW